jgi:hypothetical protein
MKKNILIISILVAISASAVFLYRESSKAENLAAAYVNKLNLDMYAQRGMVIRKPVKLNNQDSIKSVKDNFYQTEIQSIDQIFDTDPKIVISKYLELLNLDPGNISIHLRLGIINLKNHQYSSAKEHFYFIQEQKDSGLYPDSYFYLGLIQLMEGDRSKADQYFKACLNSKCTCKKEAQSMIDAL